MNEYDFSNAVAENCCRGTVEKLSSKMALSVSEEMTQRTGACQCLVDLSV